MLIAINIKIPSASELHSCFSISLGVELDKLYSVAGYISHKRYEVAFGHRMLNCDKFFVLDGLDGNSMSFVGFLSFERWKCDTATTDNSSTCSVYDIATDRADIEFREENI